MYTISIPLKTSALIGVLISLAAQTGSAQLIGFQAEDYDTGNSTIGNSIVASDTNALGGEAIEFGTGTTLRYSVTFTQAGTYDLYFRGLSTSSTSSDDSFETPDFLNNNTTGQDSVIGDSGVYAWYNSSTSTSSSSAPTYTIVSAGTYTFTVKNYRSESPRLDAFAFGVNGTTYTDAELNAAAIPEPSSFAIILAGGVGAMTLLRRRRAR